MILTQSYIPAKLLKGGCSQICRQFKAGNYFSANIKIAFQTLKIFSVLLLLLVCNFLPIQGWFLLDSWFLILLSQCWDHVPKSHYLLSSAAPRANQVVGKLARGIVGVCPSPGIKSSLVERQIIRIGVHKITTITITITIIRWLARAILGVCPSWELRVVWRSVRWSGLDCTKESLHAHNYFAYAQLAHDYQFKPHKYLGHNDFAHNYFAPDPSTRYFVLFVFKIHFDQLHFVQQYTPGDYKGVEQKARFSRP